MFVKKACAFVLVWIIAGCALAQAAGTPAPARRPAAVRADADTLGRAAIAAADKAAESSLAALARWRATTALDDTTLARARARIETMQKDLATERPTELAVYLTLDGRARPAKILLSIDGVPAAVASYGDAEWRALDSGGWAEVARRTTRSGPLEVKIDFEDANRRNQSVRWTGTLDAGRLAVLHLRLSSSAAPSLTFVQATTP